MALEQEPKQENKEGSSVLSKVLWGAAIAGAAVGAVYAAAPVLHSVGSVAEWTADKFFTVAQGVSPTGENVHSAIGTAIDNFGEKAGFLGDKVSSTLGQVFTNPNAATATTEGVLDSAKQFTNNSWEGIKHATGVLVDHPAATATIAGSAVVGTGVGMGVKSWAQKVGKNKDYDSMAARIEAERSGQDQSRTL
ncbi:MAG: hypothetical protein U1E36_02660 [Rickettsiales bacterium]